MPGPYASAAPSRVTPPRGDWLEAKRPAYPASRQATTSVGRVISHLRSEPEPSYSTHPSLTARRRVRCLTSYDKVRHRGPRRPSQRGQVDPLECLDRRAPGDRLAQAAVHPPPRGRSAHRSEEHTSELQSQSNLVCRLLLEKKNTTLA